MPRRLSSETPVPHFGRVAFVALLSVAAVACTAARAQHAALGTARTAAPEGEASALTAAIQQRLDGSARMLGYLCAAVESARSRAAQPTAAEPARQFVNAFDTDLAALARELEALRSAFEDELWDRDVVRHGAGASPRLRQLADRAAALHARVRHVYARLVLGQGTVLAGRAGPTRGPSGRLASQ